MDTKQINDQLKCLEHFHGVYARDQLPVIKKLPAALVVNTDESTQPGTHWVAIYIDENGKGEYMDSFGQRPATRDIALFLRTSCPSGWIHNPVIFQSPIASACGSYCILFLTMRAKGYPMSEFVAMFSRKEWLNDVTALYLANV